MDSKTSQIDVNNNRFTTPVAVAVDFNVKKNDDDRRVARYMQDFDNENNIRHFNNKALAESVMAATEYHAQTPTLKYLCRHIKRTEQIHTLLLAMKDKIAGQNIMSTEHLRNMPKG